MIARRARPRLAARTSPWSLTFNTLTISKTTLLGDDQKARCTVKSIAKRLDDMSLLEADFAKAIEYFVSTWRVSSIEHKKAESEEEHEKQSDWDDVLIIEKVSQSLDTFPNECLFGRFQSYGRMNDRTTD